MTCPFLLTIPTNSRAMREIERTVRRGTSTPYTRYNKEKIENHILEVQQLLDTLNAQNLPLDKTHCAVEHDLMQEEPRDIATPSVFENGMSPAPHSPTMCRMLNDPSFLNSTTAACGRLIKRAFALHELPSLIHAISSSRDDGDTTRCLPGDDAQTFIDVLYEARSTFAYHCVSEIGINAPRQPGTE